MKKSILFGALAIFAISALGIQDANAQNVEAKAKKAESTAVVEKKEKPAATTVEQTPVKEKKADCCAEKAEAKKADCCAEKKTECKKADAKKADCCEKKNCESKKAAAEANGVKKDEKQPSVDKNVTKPVSKKEVKNMKFKAKVNYEN